MILVVGNIMIQAWTNLPPNTGVETWICVVDAIKQIFTFGLRAVLIFSGWAHVVTAMSFFFGPWNWLLHSNCTIINKLYKIQEVQMRSWLDCNLMLLCSWHVSWNLTEKEKTKRKSIMFGGKLPATGSCARCFTTRFDARVENGFNLMSKNGRLWECWKSRPLSKFQLPRVPNCTHILS